MYLVVPVSSIVVRLVRDISQLLIGLAGGAKQSSVTGAGFIGMVLFGESTKGSLDSICRSTKPESKILIVVLEPFQTHVAHTAGGGRLVRRKKRAC